MFQGNPDSNKRKADRYGAALQVIASCRSDGSPQYAEPRYTAEEAREIAWKTLYEDEKEM